MFPVNISNVTRSSGGSSVYKVVEIGFGIGFDLTRNILLSVVTSLVIFGNIFALIVVRRSHFKKITKIFFYSLTVADLLVGVGAGVPLVVVHGCGKCLPHWVNTFLCRISGVADVFANTASLLSLLLLNIERYLAIEKPLTFSMLMTTNRARFLVVVVWCFALMVTGAYIPFHFKSPRYDTAFSICYPYTSICDSNLVIICMTICVFVFAPFIISAILYMRIWSIISRHRQSIGVMRALTSRIDTSTIAIQHDQQPGIIVKSDLKHDAKEIHPPRGQIQSHNATVKYSQTQLPDATALRSDAKFVCSRPTATRDMKALVTFIMSLSAFGVAWIPFAVTTFHEHVTGRKTSPYVVVFVYALVLCNNWWNLLIYTVRNVTFRKAAKKLFCSWVRSFRGYCIVSLATKFKRNSTITSLRS